MTTTDDASDAGDQRMASAITNMTIGGARHIASRAPGMFFFFVLPLLF